MIFPERAVQQIVGREGETAAFLSRCVVTFGLRVFGFATRHLNRSAVSWWQSTLAFERVLKYLSVDSLFGFGSGLTGKTEGFFFAKLFHRERTMLLFAVFNPSRAPSRAPALNSGDAAFVV